MRIPSSDIPFQEVLKKLRNPLNVNEFYTEVQERCKDLDEFIVKKQNFDIYKCAILPLSLVIGFMGGRYFTRLNEDTHPFPFLDLDIENG